MGFQHFSYYSQEVQFVTTIVLHGRCRFAVNLLSGMQNWALFLDVVTGFICLNKTLHTFISSPLFTFHPGEIQTCFLQSVRNTAVLWRAARSLGAPIRLLVVCSNLIKRVRELSRVETRLKLEKPGAELQAVPLVLKTKCRQSTFQLHKSFWWFLVAADICAKVTLRMEK